MKKIISLLVMTMLLITSFGAFADGEAVRIMALKGPTGIGMVGMMENNAEDYQFTLAGAADEIVAAIANGSTDIAAIPTNLAATLFNKTKGNVQLLALNTLGVLYLMEKGDGIQSISDLAGKSIGASGQGALPEYVLDYILKANGLEDVEVTYYAEHSELAALLASGKVELAILPQPFVTSVQMQSDARIALDITEEFGNAAKLMGEENAVLSMGCVIVRKEYAAQNPEAVEKFLADYSASVEFVNADVEAASQLVEKFEIMPKAAVAKKAIPDCHIVFIAGNEMKTQIEPLYQILMDANPASIGGKMPTDEFYYGAEE
ncbi:MAG: ABC transporter substrate-binding protein [Eubacteriales bacterium]|nr:ABC transporter substrate-binding protein [Eubacteriales bacterium]MDD3882165.1 ABC transporter substrate-binding protein [Eubacteriales bacterium]MDD4513791.1 ABC transporter substrate-binding protein [Eubacteriales bacterium]